MEAAARDPLSDVAIVIVTYASSGFIAETVRSLPLDAVAGAVVVDNASPDDTVEVVRAAANGRLQLVESPVNGGFAAGCNLGAAAAPPSRWLLFLNPDAHIAVEDLRTLVRYAEAHPRVAVVGPRLVGDGAALHSASALPSVTGELRYLMPRSLRGLFRDRRVPPGHESAGEVDYVLGACFLVDREVFEAVGGLNDEYFMFFEEADLAQRVRRLGRAEALCIDACAYHALGATRADDVVGLRDEYLRSAGLYFARWRGRGAATAFRVGASAVLTVLGVIPSRRERNRILRRALWTPSTRR